MARLLVDFIDGAGITQSDLARATGILPSLINRYIHRRHDPSASHLVVLAKFCGFTIDDIIQ